MDYVDLYLQPPLIELNPKPAFEGCFSADQLPACVQALGGEEPSWAVLLGTAGLGWALGAASSNLSFFWGWREVIPKVLVVEGRAGSPSTHGSDA